MLPIIALGALTVVTAGAYIKVGMDELKLIHEALERDRKKSYRKRRRYNKK